MKTKQVIVKNPFFETHVLNFNYDGVDGFWIFRNIKEEKTRIGYLGNTGLEIDKDKGNSAIFIHSSELLAIAKFWKNNFK